jgi:hypothetical protein
MSDLRLEGFRDAIHVPFIVCKCIATLNPGEKCSLRGGDERITYVPWRGGDAIDWHGVADPFAKDPIQPGELFRLFIRKECFSGLTHQFQIEVHDTGGTNTCHEVCNIV